MVISNWPFVHVYMHTIPPELIILKFVNLRMLQNIVIFWFDSSLVYFQILLKNMHLKLHIS